MEEKFSYSKTLKTDPQNSFLNLQQLLFITSKQLTKFFYYTRVTPHQVILLSLIFGVTASYLFVLPGKYYAIGGAVLLFYKNVLDKVDGSLARAKGLDSRRGRFYDSISDFIVTFTSFAAVSYNLYLIWGSYLAFVIGFAAMICSMLHCSYFIFYQVSFIRSTGKGTQNRLKETLTAEDIASQDKWTTFLQRIFQLIYGWQDWLFYKLDQIMIHKLTQHTQLTQNTQITQAWYQNKPFLTLASSLSIGTHIFLICIAALTGRYDYYIFVNLIFMNLLLILSVVYHYSSTINKLKTQNYR
ncbi:MAG TPA: CDP-alcohol phosphatidyltransferase family protein [Ignavibacteria bacterium]|nr:CDP-alcohol phosphatidyltransferase family protein [Ignavibacteria bacterium]